MNLSLSETLAALYGRVSTDCQPGSLETQVAAARRFATANNLTIPDELVFLDEDQSGSLPLMERPKGKLMMNTLRLYGKRVRHLVVPKLDRLGRSLMDLQLRVQELEQMGVTVHFVNLPLPSGEDGMSKALRTLFLQLLSAFAEFERNMIVERINDRMAQKRRQGELCGTVPYGFNAVATGAVRTNKAGVTRQVKRLEPNPEEQQWLRWMDEQRRAGLSYDKIAKALNARGVPAKSGGRWQCGNVAKVLGSSYTKTLLGNQEAVAA